MSDSRPEGSPKSNDDRLGIIFAWQQRFQDELVERRGLDFDQRT